ncbi:MAG: hypothetical protein ACJ8H8_08635 [Geminicoccaceae bacterium]
MAEPLGDAGQPGAFARASQLLQGQAARGMEALPEAARLLRPLAPALAGVISSSAVAAHADAYPRCDAEAQLQQKLLVREATAANLCLLLAGVLSGVVLVGPLLQPRLGELTNRVTLGLGVATLALGALAAMFSYQAREGDRLRRWLTMRGTAEMARLDTFRAVAQGAAASGTDAAAAGLALVRCHLFDHQRAWLIGAAARHRRSSERTNLWGGLATALAFVGGSGAVIASADPAKSWLPLAGVIGAAFGAYALSREGLRRDRINADRYEKAAVALDQLAAKIDPVAAEIEAGKPAALPAFVDAVTAQLESEHKQWLDGVTQAESALAALDARLKELGGSRPVG